MLLSILNFLLNVLIIVYKVPVGCVPIRCTKEMSKTRCTPQGIKVIAEDVGRYIRPNLVQYRGRIQSGCH
jgi:hypothetical protein